MAFKLCKICNTYGIPFKFYRTLRGFVCENCNNEKNDCGHNLNTFNIRKLFERIEKVEKEMDARRYEVVIDVSPLAAELNITKQKCAELISDEHTRIIIPVSE